MAGKWCRGIINPLFDGITDNTRGHFTHCSHFSSPLRGSENTTQLVKYPRVLSVKPSNKVYIFFAVTLCFKAEFLTLFLTSRQLVLQPLPSPLQYHIHFSEPRRHVAVNRNFISKFSKTGNSQDC